MSHLTTKLDQNATSEEKEAFKRVRISFLDTLADLLNDPRIAEAWEKEEEQK